MRPVPGVLAYVALGSNVGDRTAFLAGAVAALARHPEVGAVRTSPVYETAAHTLDPAEAAPPYLNAVAELQTTLAPEALLAYCLDVERAAGRDRTHARRWAPRTLDLDLLVYDALTYEAPGLVLPHPRLAERRFVLEPLAALAPNLHVPPPFDAPVHVLLARCPDRDRPARTNVEIGVRNAE